MPGSGYHERPGLFTRQGRLSQSHDQITICCNGIIFYQRLVIQSTIPAKNFLDFLPYLRRSQAVAPLDLFHYLITDNREFFLWINEKVTRV